MASTYPILSKKEKLIEKTLADEERNYLETLSKGLELINKLTEACLDKIFNVTL